MHKSWVIEHREEHELAELGEELACSRVLSSKGDIALHYYLYRIADKIWPQVTASLLSAIRKLFLSEDVFAELARLYGFPDKIIITPKTSLQHLRYNPTVLGDAFEAMVGAIDEEAAREGRQHILQWVAKLFSTDVFPTLVEVGVERNKYLKGRRAAAKEKIAKEEQRRLEEARKKDAQRDRVLDGGVAAHQYPPSRMGKSRPNPRRRRAGLARPPDAEPEWKRQRLAQRKEGDSSLPEDTSDGTILQANERKA